MISWKTLEVFYSKYEDHAIAYWKDKKINDRNLTTEEIYVNVRAIVYAVYVHLSKMRGHHPSVVRTPPSEVAERKMKYYLEKMRIKPAKDLGEELKRLAELNGFEIEIEYE